LSDLYHAFLTHSSIFREVKLIKFESELSKTFCEVIEWLQELVSMNETHPELRRELNVLCNGQKKLMVPKAKLSKWYIVKRKLTKEALTSIEKLLLLCETTGSIQSEPSTPFTFGVFKLSCTCTSGTKCLML